MALRTQIFSQLPWVGGVNSAIDSAMIPPNQLVQADHVQFDTRGSRQIRDGVNYNWDGATSSTSSLIGGFDFWYGTAARVQREIAIDSAKNVYSYTNGGTSGTRSAITLDSTAGTAWGSAITKASFEAMNNQCIIAVDGANNRPRKWAGGTNKMYDLGQLDNTFPAPVKRSFNSSSITLTFATSIDDFFDYGQQIVVTNSLDTSMNGTQTLTVFGGTTLSYRIATGQFPTSSTRSSSGTTRTVIFSSSVTGYLQMGSTIVVTGAGDSGYNGTFTVSSVSGSTITYTALTSLSESTVSDTGFLIIGTTNDTIITVQKVLNTPQCSIVRQHLGRIWTNDKTNLDRLNYSPTYDPDTWGGIGDSGAIDIGVGDGDNEGITAIFPSFKGVLFVAKRTKLYKISGLNPEDFQVDIVSNGIGCVGHNAVCTVDEEDVYFVSDRGVHSLGATINYGDFEVKFISADIQRTFRDNWTKANRKFIQCGYIPYLNSVQFAVLDTTANSSTQATIWNYNIPGQSWYRWPNIECTTYFVANDADKKRAYVGGTKQRLGQTLTGNTFDVSTAGVNIPILYTIKSGLIFPTASPYAKQEGVIWPGNASYSVKGFKKFSLVYKPQGNHNITVTLQIDNFPPQSLSFTQTDSTALLGTTFVLGSSLLGSSFVMAPYSQTIDGYGRGIQVTIQESGVDQYVEIQGFLIEYEDAGTQQEVRNTN